MLHQHISSLTIKTSGRELIEITRGARTCVVQGGIRQGLLTLFVRHTSTSLLIQKSATR